MEVEYAPTLFAFVIQSHVIHFVLFLCLKFMQVNSVTLQ